MKLIFSFLIATMLLACSSCDIIQKDKDDEPVLKLSSVGFEGTLPDGFTIKTGLVSDNGLRAGSSSSDGSIITHVITLLDTNSHINIAIDLPEVKFSNNYISFNNDSIPKAAAKLFYDFEVVKDKLSLGDKQIRSSLNTNNDNSKVFRIAVYDQKNYIGYVSDEGIQTNSYLKVIDLQEGVENDPKLGNVKTLEFTMDMNVKLYGNARFGNPITYVGDIKGLVRMKYKQKS